VHLVLLILAVVALVAVASFVAGYLVRRKNDKDPTVTVGPVSIGEKPAAPDPKAIAPKTQG